MRHGRALEELARRHPRALPSANPEDYHSKDLALFMEVGRTFRDDWGCVWECAQAGILGRVVHHPIEDWSALDALTPPDPRDQYDWRALREATESDRRAGHLTRAYYLFTQGGFFDRLQFLRGLENLLMDFLEEPPRLARLIEMLLDYNLKQIRLWNEIGVDQFYFHGDIGTQQGLMMSPATFRKHLKPAYREMFSACRRAGAHVWYSSDGRILPLVDDLIECGVTLHDPQVRANTIDGIARTYKGKLCALVDIDQQMLPYCTPEDIHRQVREVVEKMGNPQGGLMIYAIPSADVPIENIEALCTAWETYGG
jgi:uroporphyrinogen decarboxylase